MNAVAKVDPAEPINTAIEKMAPQFKAALPAHIPVEKFQRVALVAIQRNPDLLNADRKSLFLACQQAASDGLLPDNRESALVVFNAKVKVNGQDTWIKKVQYLPMIYGIFKKVRNSGLIATTHVEIIRKNDEFRYWTDDDGPHLLHTPLMFGERGDIIGVYAMAKTTDGQMYVEVMDVPAIEHVRSISRSKDSGPWKEWWDEMAKKTVFRRLSKRLPMSTDQEELIHRDDELYEPIEAPSTPRPSREMPQVEDSSGHDNHGFAFMGADGSEVLYENPADYVKAFGDAIRAAGKDLKQIDGIWESNSPMLASLPDDAAQACRDLHTEAIEGAKAKPAPVAAQKPKPLPKAASVAQEPPPPTDADVNGGNEEDPI